METRPRGDVGDEHRDEEGGDPVGTLEDVGGAVVLEGLHPADAAADDDAGALRVGERCLRSPACVTAWWAAAEGELGEEVVAPGFLPVHVLAAGRTPSPRRRTAR